MYEVTIQGPERLGVYSTRTKAEAIELMACEVVRNSSWRNWLSMRKNALKNMFAVVGELKITIKQQHVGGY